MSKQSAALRILVTGAGSRIGAAIATAMAARGHQVIGTVRTVERAADLNARLCSSSDRVEYLGLDLNDRESIVALARHVDRTSLDVLINNAGYSLFGPIEHLTPEQIAHQFQVNVFGPVELTRLLLPKLRDQRGMVIWIGSLMNYAPLPFQGAYAASKSAVAAISDALRMELEPQGVRVTCIESGDIATDLTCNRVFAETADDLYTVRIRNCRGLVERSELAAPAPDIVAKAVARIIENPPPPRLAIGRYARLLRLLAVSLPGGLRLRVTRWLYGG